MRLHCPGYETHSTAASHRHRLPSFPAWQHSRAPAGGRAPFHAAWAAAHPAADPGWVQTLDSILQPALTALPGPTLAVWICVMAYAFAATDKPACGLSTYLYHHHLVAPNPLKPAPLEPPLPLQKNMQPQAETDSTACATCTHQLANSSASPAPPAPISSSGHRLYRPAYAT